MFYFLRNIYLYTYICNGMITKDECEEKQNCAKFREELVWYLTSTSKSPITSPILMGTR